jgi:transposase-like protein
MKGTPVPQPVRELIVSRVTNGEKVDDLAREFSLYPNTIRKWLKDHNYNSTSGTTTTSKSQSSDILLISKLRREKQELLEIIGELTVLTKRSKKN